MTDTVRPPLLPPLPKSIATVSLSGTLPEKLDAAASVGFDGVEIFESDLLTFDGSPRDVRDIAEGLGLAITIFQPFRDFEAMPEPLRTRNLDRAERKFDVMQELGTDLVLVCSNIHPSTIDEDSRAAADLAEMAERAKRRGLRVGYEALAWGRHVNQWRHAWNIVRMANHESLGLIVDSFHTLAVGDGASGIATLPADRLFFVHLADAPKLTLDALSWSRHFRNFPGQGELPIADFLRSVLAAGYRGPLSLEVLNDEFRAAPARLVARDGLRSLRLVEAEAGAATLPQPPAFDGIEFLEFAVDDDAGRRLGELLRDMGFHYAGRHRSKSVDLFSQGRVNLVLNSEPDSAAAEHFQMHGPSVCAMALRVDDAERGLARARALLCPDWQERIGEGERRIPALRAPDGTLIYLVQPDPSGRSIYEDDFRQFADQPVRPALTAIDHVAQALPVSRMDNFVLFYRAVLGFLPEQLWEIADSYGVVRSRTMVSPERSVRLPLNVSESRETGTGRFLTTYAGAGVYHIAMATDDIFDAVERLSARGAHMLPIPANYYDDLAAKWGLDDTYLRRLQQLNLLYDRDDTGEFLNAYTDTFDNRFFSRLSNAAMAISSTARRTPSFVWRRRPNVAVPLNCVGCLHSPAAVSRGNHGIQGQKGKRMTAAKPELVLPRRQALLGAAAVAASPLAKPFIGNAAAAETIKIGLLLAKTGDIAAQTEYLANGTYLALEERGNKIMGQPAELVWLDEPSPQGSQQNMQKLVQENKVCAILGGSLSSNGLAEQATAAQLKIPFVCNNAAATDMSGKNCNHYTFRLNTPVAVQAAMFAPYIMGYGKKWYFITANYAFGQDIAKSFKEILAKAGGTIVGDDSVPLNTPDYSSFILKIRQAKPDMILGGVPAGDLSTFLKQWNEMGMKGTIPICEIAIGDTDIWAVGPDAATGLYTALWWYNNSNNPPEEKAMAAAYQKKFGKPAADKAWMGWIAAKSLFESIEMAKSTETEAIIKALESWKGGSAANPYYWRKGDHQMLLRNLVVQAKPKITDKWDYFDVKGVVPENVADLEKVFGDPVANGCRMT